MRHGQAINQAMVDIEIQRLDRSRHGNVGGLQHIELIDIGGFEHRQPPTDLRLRHELLEEKLPPLLGQLLRIIEPLEGETLWQHDRGRRNRTGQWPASGFIDTCNHLMAALKRCSFK